MKYKAQVEDLQEKILKCYNELTSAVSDKDRTAIRFQYGLSIFIAALTLEIRLGKYKP